MSMVVLTKIVKIIHTTLRLTWSCKASVEVKAHPTETLKITQALAPPPNLPTRSALPSPLPPAPNLSITPPTRHFSRLFTSKAWRKEFPGIQQVFLERAELNPTAGSKRAVVNNAARRAHT